MNQPVSEDRRQSPLFQRFNGVMFSFFAQMASFRAAREQWTQLRAQMSRFVSEIHLDAVIPVQVVDFANRRNDLFHAVLGLGALGEFLRRIPSNHGHATAFICFGGLCSPIREGHLRGRSATNGYEIGNEIARRVILSGGRVRVVPEGSTSQSEASRGDFALRRLGQHSREESATGLRVSSRSVRPDPIHADPVKAFCHETHPH